jgi:hypothetical protein
VGVDSTLEWVNTFGAHLAVTVLVGVLTFLAGVFVRRIKDHRIDRISETVKSLATQYECANWIEDQDKRIAMKEKIFSQMRLYCKTNKIPKQQIINSQQFGRIMMIAASILENPTKDDIKFVLQVKGERLAPGHSRYKFFDAVELLISRVDLIPERQQRELAEWLFEMGRGDRELCGRVIEIAKASNIFGDISPEWAEQHRYFDPKVLERDFGERLLPLLTDHIKRGASQSASCERDLIAAS